MTPPDLPVTPSKLRAMTDEELMETVIWLTDNAYLTGQARVERIELARLLLAAAAGAVATWLVGVIL